LQSRFSAFAYRLPGYIIETTHETCRDFQEDKIAWAKDLNKQGMFDSYDFVELMAGEEESGSTSTTDEEEAFVDFRVRLRANAKTGKYMEGEEMVIMERSRFLKDETGWKYAGGDVRTDVAGIEDVVLNT
jgi:SEC-C motif-containing protein